MTEEAAIDTGVRVAAPLMQLTKQKILERLYHHLNERLTHFAHLESPFLATRKAYMRDITRILKHILRNIDLRKPLVNQIDATSMLKLIALEKQDMDFGESLLLGLTNKEIQRLLPLVQYAEQQLKSQESAKSITPKFITIADFQT